MYYLKCADCGNKAEEATAGETTRKCDSCGGVMVSEAVEKSHGEVTAMINPLFRRANLFLEDGEWSSAIEYFERVLDLNPECAEAYVGKLCADLKCHSEAELVNCEKVFSENYNYTKAMRFGSTELADKLQDCCKEIVLRNDKTKLNLDYKSLLKEKSGSGRSWRKLLKAAEGFRKLNTYKDAQELAVQCEDEAECILSGLYESAKKRFDAASTVDEYKKALEEFKTLEDYKDSATLLRNCEKKILEEKVRLEELANKEKERKENIRLIIIGVCLITLVVWIVRSYLRDVTEAQVAEETVVIVETEDVAEAGLEEARLDVIDRWTNTSSDVATAKYIEDIYKEYPEDETIANIYYYCIAQQQYNYYIELGTSRYLDNAIEYAAKIDPDYDGEFSEEIQAYADKILGYDENRAETVAAVTESTDIYNSLTNADKKEICEFIEDRYEYYDGINGGYAGDKYTDTIWAEVAEKYGLMDSQIDTIWINAYSY